jgi:dTDP-4-amino-4,6-dideoxygalactose transaminase
VDSGNVKVYDEQRLKQNYHEFYLLVKTPEIRKQLIQFLSQNHIQAVSHYYPLHLSAMGKKFNHRLDLPVTEYVADCIVRLPMHQQLSMSDVQRVAYTVLSFFNP